ncbi:MAG: hypothetical protein LBQ66_08710 [Planctomycetaceae bacterium]|jgi:hypothetical protein|nr:hypothetical protein [Planctomycetaceae bacterium]
MSNTDWHSAFVAAVKMDNIENRDAMSFLNEFTVTSGQLKVDLIVIMNADVVVKSALTKNFRKVNIIEYKGPGDSANIETFHKTVAYCLLYMVKFRTDVDDITGTIVTSHYPHKLFGYLERLSIPFVYEGDGIYLVNIRMFPIRIVLVHELPASDCHCVKSMHCEVAQEEFERVLEEIRSRAKIPVSVGGNVERSDQSELTAFLDVFFKLNEENFMRSKMSTSIAEFLREFKWLSETEHEARLKKKEAEWQAKLEAERNTRNNMVIKLLLSGIDKETIAGAAGISVKEIERLQKKK